MQILFSKREELCPRCGRPFEAFFGKRFCDACIPALEAEQRTDAAAAKAADLADMGLLMPRTAGTRFETSKAPYRANAAAWAACKNWRRKENIYLYGPPGTGKSHLARCVLMENITTGRSVAETTAARFTVASNRFDTAPDFFRRLSRASVLLLDDLDKGLWNDRSLIQLWELLDLRYQTRRRVIVTSNLSPAAMAGFWAAAAPTNASLAQGISDRLLPCGVFALDGPSMRGNEGGV